MSKQKIRFIINPISGKKHKDHLPQQIEEHLDHSRFDYEIFISNYAGHASILAQDAINQHVDILAVAGGDGSINEVGTTLIGTDMALAVIPCGSGNGLSRCMNLPLDPIKALQVINKNYRRKIDTVTVNDKSFISISGTGYDAKVAEDYSKDLRRGFDTYFRYIIRNYITMEPDCMHHEVKLMDVDDKHVFYDKLTFVYLEMPKFNKTEDQLDGMMDKAPKVKIIQTSEATIIRPKADVINLDGESVMMEKDLHLKVNPLSLNIICNETQK